MSKGIRTHDDEELEDLYEGNGEPEPVEFWKKKQRELVTSVVDYNLDTLTNLMNDGVIDSAPKYQRRFRWDAARQSKLIESFLMNVPVPPVFLNEDKFGKYSVIDGKQRLTAITAFLNGALTLEGLTVFSDVNGLSIRDFPPTLRTILKTRPTLRAVIILPQSDTDVKFEVFQRLNTGGIKLNAQEIRNSTYPGPLNDLLLELSENKKFQRMLGIKQKSTSTIYQEMRDVELVLRYAAFRTSWKDYSGGMKRRLDNFMADNQRMSKSKLAAEKRALLDTLDVVDAAFGEFAFRRYVPEKGAWRKQLLVSMYDAQMFACQGLDADKCAAKQERILSALMEKFSDSEFRASVDAATNTPTLFRRRIEQISKLIRSVTK